MRMRDRNGATRMSIENHAPAGAPVIFILSGWHDKQEKILQIHQFDPLKGRC